MNPTSLKNDLGLDSRDAKFFRNLSQETVECYLCPRHCKINDQRGGFCKVRWNEGGKLKTLNYGVSVQMTQEVIETEAVNHFAPGTPILSLGNVGCMMNCDYCHNWKTSQMREVKRKDIHHYTPEQVVSTALEKNIKILSWTYNDPVVWHEFVYDTAKLARKHGLINLYKSAFYIGPEAIEELHEVIDIFSISLKSLNPEIYLKTTKGQLQPVLDGIKQVYNYKSHHLELSNLVVTDSTDKMEEIERLVNWILTELDDSVPLHLVRFHPDYKYTHVERTSIEFLKAARERALEMGLKHCYLGNVYEAGEWLNTRCKCCKELLVKRFGLQTQIPGLTSDGMCLKCGEKSSIVTISSSSVVPLNSVKDDLSHSKLISWSSEANAAHLVAKNHATVPMSFRYRHLGKESFAEINLTPGENWRFLISRDSHDSTGIEVLYPEQMDLNFLEVLDRAHFPVS